MNQRLFPILLLLCLHVGFVHAQDVLEDPDETLVGVRGPLGTVLLWGDDQAPPGARYRIERASGEGWIRINATPIGLPATMSAAKSLFGDDWAALMELFEVRTDEQLFQALRSFADPSGFLALFDPSFGERMGRRFTDPSPPAGSQRYRVVREGMQTVVLGEISVGETAPEVLPVPTLAVVVDSLTANVTLRYKRSASPHALTYNFYRQDSGRLVTRINTNTVVAVQPADSDDEDPWFYFEDFSAVPGESYTYSIRAVDLGGNESADTQAPTITLPLPLPAPPENIAAQLSEDGFPLLSWDPATDEGATRAYAVYRGEGSDEEMQRIEGVLLPQSDIRWVDVSAEPGRVYAYALAALGLDASRWTLSNTVYLEVPNLPVPPVTQVRAESHPEGVLLRWFYRFDDFRFNVYRLEAPDDSIGALFAFDLREPSILDTLDAGTAFWYRIVPSDSTGMEGVASDPLLGQSGRPLPLGDAPINVSLSGAAPPYLVWELPASRLPDALRLYREETVWATVSPEVTLLPDSSDTLPRYYLISSVFGEAEVFSDTLWVQVDEDVFAMPVPELSATREGAILTWESRPGTRFQIFRQVEDGEETRVAEVETDASGMGVYLDTSLSEGQIVMMRLVMASDPEQSSGLLITRIPFADEYEDD